MTAAEDFHSTLIVNSVFNACLSYTAIMFNIVTIRALRKTPSLPKPLKTLLLSLAVSDLGVGLLGQPLNVACLVMRLTENTKINPAYNITDIYVYRVTTTYLSCASFFGVTALTVDRFLAIHLHLRYQEIVTHRRVAAVVTSNWLLSAILSALWLCNPKILSTVSGIIAIACLILTALFCCKIYFAVRRHTNQIQVLQVQQVAQNDGITANTARQIKSAVATFYVFLVFLICYLPFISVGVVYAITGPSITIKTLWDYTVTLVYLNSSLNPLIYCWKMRHIRHAIMNILRNMFSTETTN